MFPLPGLQPAEAKSKLVLEQATAALVRAVEIHPWLKERHMLPPDAVPQPPAGEQEL